MRNILFLFFALSVLFFSQLGTRPLANPDEGRYASIGLEMLQSQDWIVPRLNGLVYFEKPPLAYWCCALGQKWFGENLFGARFFNALCSLLTCIALFLFCKRFLSMKGAYWAAIIYGTAGLPWGMSQMLTLDNTLTFFLTTTLLLFVSAFLEEDSHKSFKLFLFAYFFMGLTVLTKGLIGIVLPGLIGLPWLILTKRIKQLRKAHLLLGIFIVLIVTAPWHYFVQQRFPCFSHFYFWHEHFERYLTDVHARVKPWYFLVNSFLLGLFPWTFFLLRMLKKAFIKCSLVEKQVLQFSLLWSTLVVLFFATSHSQLIPYILPAISGISLLLAVGMSKIEFKTLRLEITLCGMFLFIAACMIPFIVQKRALDIVPIPLIGITQGLLIFTTSLALFFVKKRATLAFCFLLGSTCLIYLLLPQFLPYFQRDNGYRLSQVLNAQKGNASIYCVYNYFNDLPFYLKQPVYVVDAIPEEHRLGLKTEPCDRYINLSTFKQHWIDSQTRYAVVQRKNEATFNKQMRNLPLYSFYRDPFFTLYSNQP